MNLPQPLWAVVLAVLGVVLAIAVYVIPGDNASRQAIFHIASDLVSGALGAFAGHAAFGSKQNPPPTTPQGE